MQIADQSIVLPDAGLANSQDIMMQIQFISEQRTCDEVAAAHFWTHWESQSNRDLRSDHVELSSSSLITR